MRMIRSGLILLFLSLLTLSSSRAGSFDGNAKILLHAVTATFKNTDACQVGRSSIANCSLASTAAAVDPLNPYFVYLIADKGDFAGLFGFYCGITYQNGLVTGQNDHVGVDVFEWQQCGTGDLPYGSPWPAPNSGNLIYYDSAVFGCPGPNPVIGGWFYLAAYSPDEMQVIKRPSDSRARIAAYRPPEHCPEFDEYDLQTTDLGSLKFTAGAVESGCNPCLNPCPTGAIPVRHQTWSMIKNLYRLESLPSSLSFRPGLTESGRSAHEGPPSRR